MAYFSNLNCTIIKDIYNYFANKNIYYPVWRDYNHDGKILERLNAMVNVDVKINHIEHNETQRYQQGEMLSFDASKNEYNDDTTYQNSKINNFFFDKDTNSVNNLTNVEPLDSYESHNVSKDIDSVNNLDSCESHNDKNSNIQLHIQHNIDAILTKIDIECTSNINNFEKLKNQYIVLIGFNAVLKYVLSEILNLLKIMHKKEPIRQIIIHEKYLTTQNIQCEIFDDFCKIINKIIFDINQNINDIIRDDNEKFLTYKNYYMYIIAFDEKLRDKSNTIVEAITNIYKSHTKNNY
jgi:hypothetical protein